MKHVLEQQSNLTIFQAMVNGLIVEKSHCRGVETSMGLNSSPNQLLSQQVPFYKHQLIGKTKSSGRLGDHTATGLSSHFIKHGIELRRFKTGTPPRLLGRSLNLDGLEVQSGDKNQPGFAFYDTRSEDELFHVEHKGRWIQKCSNQLGKNLINCYLTETTCKSHLNN